jgi:hypothetical protein
VDGAEQLGRARSFEEMGTLALSERNALPAHKVLLAIQKQKVSAVAACHVVGWIVRGGRMGDGGEVKLARVTRVTSGVGLWDWNEIADVRDTIDHTSTNHKAEITIYSLIANDSSSPLGPPSSSSDRST